LRTPALTPKRYESMIKGGIKTVIQVNIINREENNFERIIEFDKELFKKRRSIERFFSHIEAYKKIYPGHEQKEDSYLGLVQMMCDLIIW